MATRRTGSPSQTRTAVRRYHRDDLQELEEDYPQPIKAPAGAPNVLLILVDDLGFGQPGTFGGPVPTPNLDKLAAQGLRYNEFNTTAICSPTRAALLTGRNHHQVATGTITELSTGYPGYNSVWGKNVASIAEVTRAERVRHRGVRQVAQHA